MNRGDAICRTFYDRTGDLGNRFGPGTKRYLQRLLPLMTLQERDLAQLAPSSGQQAFEVTLDALRREVRNLHSYFLAREHHLHGQVAARKLAAARAAVEYSSAARRFGFQTCGSEE